MPGKPQIHLNEGPFGPVQSISAGDDVGGTAGVWFCFDCLLHGLCHGPFQNYIRHCSSEVECCKRSCCFPNTRWVVNQHMEPQNHMGFVHLWSSRYVVMCFHLLQQASKRTLLEVLQPDHLEDASP